MCGINGFSGKNKEWLDLMNRQTHHRGPDFSGSFFDEEVSLGHNLLSIREIANLSKQPFTKTNSPWILLFNGQVYNTKQLKEELGHEYADIDLDTAIIFGLIEKRGFKFIEKIHGMFAIALYNKESKEIRLYRDPSGQKPLYYYSKNNEFIFSSEIKGILAHPHIDKKVDEEAVLIGTGLGYIPGQKTLFSHIQKVRPSEEVIFNLSTKKISSSFYTSLAPHYFSENFEKAFEELVAEHLQSKQKVSINLSGGLDSSLLLHEMKKAQKNIDSYTTMFEGAHEKYNRDALLARKLSEDYGTTHHEIKINKKSYLERLRKAFEIIEEPNFNISLPVYLETAEREGIDGDKSRTIISGNGGDEIFGGYPHYYESLRMDTLRAILTPFGFNLLKNWRNNSNTNFSDINDRWLFLRSFSYRPTEKSDNKILLEYISKEIKPLETLYGLQKNNVYRTMLRDRFLWMPGENFIQADKLYMSQSVEVRAPLSYHPFRLHCDQKLKKADYTSKASNKIFLRNLYKGKLPDYIINRSDKTGWRGPLVDWYDEEFKEVFLEILSPMRGKNGLIHWDKIYSFVEKKNTWPGKYIHLYLSLALLSKKYSIDL